MFDVSKPYVAVKGYNTAKVWDVYEMGAQEGQVVGTKICRIEDQDEQAARDKAFLLAAAPEMLDLCRGMQDLIHRCGLVVPSDFEQILNEVVSKAEMGR